jgi:Phage tail lysozyme
MSSNHLRRWAPWILASATALTAGCAATTDDGSVETSQSAVTESNNHTAFDFFVAKGLSNVQAAGIVGNLDQESSMDPTVWEYGGGPGRGIAQWSAGGRWDSDHDDNVEWYASLHGDSKYSLTLQLDFIWYELETFSGYGLSELKRATTIAEAEYAFQAYFEKCGTCDESQRIAYAEAAYSAYAHGGSGGGGSSGGKRCYSDTLGKSMPDNACVQSASNADWYQCDDGGWTDRWTDPSACDGVYPLEASDKGGCYSDTLGREMPDNACVQSKYDSDWYQCKNGSWDDRWTDPAACDGTYPL